MRNIVLLLTAALVLVLVNYSIWQKETLIKSGRTLLLELAPVDPRSLMQGDYMALRFKLATEAFPHDKIKTLKDGRIVLAVDPNNVATFRRFSDGRTDADEALLRYRIRNNQPKFASNAFFFQEKHGSYYQNAKYGEFKVSTNGEALLVALRGADLQTLGPKPGETQ
ncbi:MAG: GDYXXLXY domain-containing protein [Deltaproteobacteria bacterium]|nr:GDYXXLXY domain-containing protein [Deltaproteobacteria bacterium]